MGDQLRFDLTQFDSKAVNLDLKIKPTKAVEITVRPEATEITGTVEPTSGVGLLPNHGRGQKRDA